MDTLQQFAGPTTPIGAGVDLRRGIRLLRLLAFLFGGGALALVVLLALFPTLDMAVEARSSGLAGITLAGLLLALSGIMAALPIATCRLACAEERRRQRLPRLLRFRPVDPARRLSWMARRPQGIIIPVICVGAGIAVWLLRPQMPGALAPQAMILGAGAIVLGFPLLVAQKLMAAVPRHELVEADALSALLRVPVIIVPLAGVVDIGAAEGFGYARPVMAVLAVFIGVVAAELGLRALGNWFLPPPTPAEARASVTSLAARLLHDGSVGEGLAAPIRAQLGIDFSRSWALRYARSAALPVGLGLALLAWGLTGAALIPLDQRGVYERFGKPVAVWQPGAHLGLPWPLGRVRMVELGVVHTMTLGGTEPPDTVSRAEDPPPDSANRLWDKVHPAETSYIIASVETSGAQSFQSVDADLKVLYRTGLDDASALRAAYGVTSADQLVRSETGRLLARVFAGRLLNDVIGTDRETLAENLRRDLQAELDRRHSGIEVMQVVIEAIHPPLAAAQAYHNVQAAEIVANTAISTERGRAVASAAMARQTATGITDAAKGAASSTVADANVLLRNFTADQQAAAVGGEAFLLERYFANLSMALLKSPLVIVDHRLQGPTAPVIDLRSFGAPGVTRSGDED